MQCDFIKKTKSKSQAGSVLVEQTSSEPEHGSVLFPPARLATQKEEGWHLPDEFLSSLSLSP